MNNCSFFGKLKEEPLYREVNSVPCVQFTLVIELFRVNKKGSKIVEYVDVPFQVWDSAADTIIKNAKVGDLILIKDSSPKNYEDDSLFFRVNEFKILRNLGEVNE